MAGRYCGVIYTMAQLSVNRMMAVKKAPVLGNFGVAIAGLGALSP